MFRWEVFFQIKAQIQSYERTASLISLLSGSGRRNPSTNALAFKVLYGLLVQIRREQKKLGFSIKIEITSRIRQGNSKK